MAILNKVTLGRLFADNEVWILAIMPLCPTPHPPFLYLSWPTLLPWVLITSYLSYHCLTPWLADDLPQPPLLHYCFLVHLSFYEWCTRLVLPLSHRASCLVFLSARKSSPSQIILSSSFRFCLFSPLLSSTVQLLYLYRTGFRDTLLFCLVLGQTFMKSVLISALTLPLYCFIISPSAQTTDSKQTER